MSQKLVIAIPTYQQVSTFFFANFLALNRKNVDLVATVTSKGVYVASAMRGFVDQLRERKIDYDRLLILECDMIPPHDVLQKHAQYDQPIVGAAYFMHETPYQPIFTAPDDANGYHRTFSMKEVRTMMENPALYECMNVGFGCTSIRRDVLEEWPAGEHTFANRQGLTADGTLVEMGHDVAFCLRARQLGWKSFVDTSVQCGHLSETSVSYEDNKRAYDELQRKLEAGELPTSAWDTKSWQTRLTDMARVPGASVEDYTEPSAQEASTVTLNPYNLLRP